MCEQWDSNVRHTIDFRKDQDMTTDHSLITHTDPSDPSDPPNPTRNHPTWPFLHFMTFYTIQTKYFLKTHGTHWLLTVSQEKSQPLSGLRPLLWHSALVMFWTTRVTLNYKLVKNLLWFEKCIAVQQPSSQMTILKRFSDDKWRLAMLLLIL